MLVAVLSATTNANKPSDPDHNHSNKVWFCMKERGWHIGRAIHCEVKTIKITWVINALIFARFQRITK